MTKKEEIMAAIGPKGIVNLYHIISAPLWLILDGMILVKMPAANLLYSTDFPRSGWTRPEDGIIIKMSGWGEIKVYGSTYYK